MYGDIRNSAIRLIALWDNIIKLLARLRIICRVVWCGSGFDSENEPHVLVKTFTCGFAVNSSDLFYTTKSQGNEPTFLKTAVRM